MSEENRAITQIVERLAKQFPDRPLDEVALVVGQSRPEFEQAPIRDFIPLFVERAAKNRLRQPTSSSRPLPSTDGSSVRQPEGVRAPKS